MELVEFRKSYFADLLKIIKKDGDVVDSDTILKEVLNFLVEVDFKKIDLKRSVFRRNNNHKTSTLHIISDDGTNCDLYFTVNSNTINIQIGKGWGEYLFNQEISDWKDLRKLRSALRDLFYESIDEVLIYCNEKLIRCKYMVPYSLDGQIGNYEFYSKFGIRWFWQSKLKKYYKYKAWL